MIKMATDNFFNVTYNRGRGSLQQEQQQRSRGREGVERDKKTAM